MILTVKKRYLVEGKSTNFVLDQIFIYAFNILQSYLMKSDLITKHTTGQKVGILFFKKSLMLTKDAII